MDLNVDMVSPERPGIYESKWRMSTPSGSYFGGWYFLPPHRGYNITVEELEITPEC
jgi:hypothetical protein